MKIIDYNHFICNHSIFRHDNFIGCFSADKIKMSARKYFCFNISKLNRGIIVAISALDVQFVQNLTHGFECLDTCGNQGKA